MTRERVIRYWVETLPGNRGQLHADLIEDGEGCGTWMVGSPAPLATVQADARHRNGEEEKP